MPGDRTREWRNKFELLGPAAASQINTTLADGIFTKGCTLQRIICDVSLSPITVDLITVVHMAIWSGEQGGIPSNISVDDNFSYLMRVSVPITLESISNVGEGEPRYTRFSWDLKGQRRARATTEGVFFIILPDTSSAVNCWLSTRVMCLLN